MPWWWPFKKKRAEAARAELDFRESLSQALLRQGDLEAATAKLKASRKQKRDDAIIEPIKPRVRNA